MRVRFLSPAEEELAEAAAYYQSLSPGLGVIYTIDDDEIVVVSVMNLRRKPNSWKDRAGYS